MVSASGSLLSEVTQGAATVWRSLLLNIPRQCIHVARAATITCMVRGGCNCMEWGLVTCGGRGRMVNKRPWAATPRKGHPLLHPAPLFLYPAQDHGHNQWQGQGHQFANDDVKLLKTRYSDTCPGPRAMCLCPVQTHVFVSCVLSRPTCLVSIDSATLQAPCPCKDTCSWSPPLSTLCPANIHILSHDGGDWIGKG